TSVTACIRLCLVCQSCLLGTAYVCDIRTSYVNRQCTSSDGDSVAPCLMRRLATLADPCLLRGLAIDLLGWLVLAS
ncbi:hypothetical protein Tco_0615667, partial [Tanacetum coccineum]